MAIVERNSELGAQIVADAKQYVLHSWSVQDAVDPIPVAGGEGRYFWDYDGKRYLDFASQLVNLSLGHQHPKVVAAIKEQADKLCTIGPPMATEPRSTLARLLAEVTPGDLEMSFFTNGGAEANENAIKLARWYTGRNKIIARYRSYHGATGGAITLTGDPRRWPAEPGIPGVVRMLDCFWGIELVKNRETREPLVPFNATGEAFAPVARVYKAALERGLYLMTHWNVVMVCPPLTITRDEIEEGVAILDEALSLADEYSV